MTTGGNVPGDSEIVEMLIVHFQSSIKFNSHSASTCYSNSATQYTSGMYSYSSSLHPSFPLFFFHLLFHLILPSSAPLSSCHHWQREGNCVNTIDDLEHMCASLMRPTNTWSSDSLSIHLSLISFASSLLSSPLLLYTHLPSPHFLLSKFISLQVPSLHPPPTHSPLFISAAVPSQCSAFNHFVPL